MKDLNILGLDIGGANTKAALLKFSNSEVQYSISYIEYFPFWEKTLKDFPPLLKNIKSKLIKKAKIKANDLDYISITITAELSDAFQTKKEGILTIIAALETIFEKEKMFFIGSNGKFLDIERAKNEYNIIAAANWVSTSLFLGKYVPQCILIDAGSTTIDMIPILDSKPVAKGKTDIERLLNHELIYTGALRATIPSLTHFVPYKGENVRISFEKFALIADVHRILYNISEDEYLIDTADNRSKSIEDCYARLARVICMDKETLPKDDLNQIAKYIYDKQLELISGEIQLFMNGLASRIPKFVNDPIFVITGLAAEFLIRRSLIHLGYNNILTYEDSAHISDSVSTSAIAIAGALYFQL